MFVICKRSLWTVEESVSLALGDDGGVGNLTFAVTTVVLFCPGISLPFRVWGE